MKTFWRNCKKICNNSWHNFLIWQNSEKTRNFLNKIFVQFFKKIDEILVFVFWISHFFFRLFFSLPFLRFSEKYRKILRLVMGSIEENRYRYFGISVDSIDTQISSENPHHELHIHKLVVYFDFRTSNFLGFFAICPVSAHFWLFPLNFFLGVFGHYSSDNTKYP